MREPSKIDSYVETFNTGYPYAPRKRDRPQWFNVISDKVRFDTRRTRQHEKLAPLTHEHRALSYSGSMPVSQDTPFKGHKITKNRVMYDFMHVVSLFYSENQQEMLSTVPVHNSKSVNNKILHYNVNIFSLSLCARSIRILIRFGIPLC